MGQVALPSFAAEWMSQWNAAGPALERVRADELRALDSAALNRAGSVLAAPRDASNYSGLIDQQAWFMRYKVLELLRGTSRSQ